MPATLSQSRFLTAFTQSGSPVWTGITSLGADDAYYASCAMGAGDTYTAYVTGLGGGFSIPAGATIVGVVLESGAYVFSGVGIAGAFWSKLVKGGAVTGDEKTTVLTAPPPYTPQAVSQGGAADMWNATLTPSDVNATNFGARFRISQAAGVSNSAFASFLKLTVYYAVPSAPIDADVVIDGYAYVVKNWHGSYSRFRVNDFAPKLATGKRSHDDLDGWSVVSWDNWSGGVGQLKWQSERASKYWYGTGAETRIANVLTSGGKWNTANLAQSIIKFVEFNGSVFAIGATDVYLYNNGANTWTGEGRAFATPPIDAEVFGNYLVVSFGASADLQTRTTAGVWATISSPATKYTYLKVWGQVLWLCGTDNITISSTQNLTSFTTATPLAGTIDTAFTGLSVSPSGYLVIHKTGNVFYYNGTTMSEAFNFPQQTYADNGKWSIQHAPDGSVYSSIQARVKKYSFVGTPSMSDVTPELQGDKDKDNYGYNLPMAFASSPRWIFAIFKNMENTTDGMVMAYDGAGWHPLQRKTAWTPQAIFYSRVTSKLFVNWGATNGTFYQLYNSLVGTVAEYDNVNAPHVILPRFDAGFEEVPKAFRYVRVIARGASSTEKAKIYYRLDDKDNTTSWTYLGEVTSNDTTLSFTGGSTAISGKTIQFYIEVYSGATTATIGILSITLDYLLRPNPLYGYRINVWLASGNVDRLGNSLGTFAAQLARLNTVEASVLPLVIDTPDAFRHRAYITGTRTLQRRRQENGAIEEEVEITFIDTETPTAIT